MIITHGLLLFIKNMPYDKRNITLYFSYKRKTQGILTIHHDLYIWYDEGDFPKFFDTIKDKDGNNRLKIVGVDEV